jgi:hypothetical protein
VKFWLSYHDIPDAPRNQFRVLPTPGVGDRVVSEGKFPGAYGFSDIFITHIAFEYVAGSKRFDVMVIAYTEVQLLAGDKDMLAEAAWTFLLQTNVLQVDPLSHEININREGRDDQKDP